MKSKKILLLPALLLIGFVILFTTISPKEVEATRAPTRHKVWCDDEANYYCEISLDAPYCDGITDPEWDNSGICPVPRGRVYCPTNYYYCDVDVDGPLYCSKQHVNWDITWGPCPN
ncbi:MAG: hypothetical protein J7L96_07075 [Bacteroidales bacterium]|nr:hypothetical protein [Bacteroidales bacterium]